MIFPSPHPGCSHLYNTHNAHCTLFPFCSIHSPSFLPSFLNLSHARNYPLNFTPSTQWIRYSDCRRTRVREETHASFGQSWERHTQKKAESQSTDFPFERKGQISSHIYLCEFLVSFVVAIRIIVDSPFAFSLSPSPLTLILSIPISSWEMIVLSPFSSSFPSRPFNWLESRWPPHSLILLFTPVSPSHRPVTD